MMETVEANEAAEANAEPNECRKCKANERKKFITEVLSMKKNLDHARSVKANFYFIIVRLLLPDFKQPARMGKTERNLIRHLRERELSIGDIAWILNRSKSTIHDNLNEVRESSNSEPNEGR